MAKTLIRRPCQDCGIPTTRRRCEMCAKPVEEARQARQWYRAAYRSREYRAAKRVVRKRSGGRCEFTHYDRCTAKATEFHHIVPLSTAQSLEEAIRLCDPPLLRHVCQPHNPRGPVPR